jgi:hypothetical protein
MGYHTDFNGQFDLNKPLKPEHMAYLCAFNQSRRMKRNASVTEALSDPYRNDANLPVGIDGGYFVGTAGWDNGNTGGQSHTPDVLEYNYPPKGQPGLWCQWVPTGDGTAITWDEGEKFYDYVEWIEYLVSNFLKPWGYSLNGEVEWFGEDRNDMGRIVISDNIVEVQVAHISYK